MGYRAAIPEDWQEMLDVMMETIDREDLDSEALVPARRLWCDYGIVWVNWLATGGVQQISQHPVTNVSVKT